MTLREAYLKAKAATTCRFLWSVCDFGKFWGFWFAPMPYDPDNPVGGCSYHTIDKETGERGFITGPEAALTFSSDEVIDLPLEQFKKWDAAEQPKPARATAAPAYAAPRARRGELAMA